MPGLCAQQILKGRRWPQWCQSSWVVKVDLKLSRGFGALDTVEQLDIACMACMSYNVCTLNR